jgi:DedD protein
MPFFNFRRGGSNAAPNAGPAAQPESVEVMRKRAKHRLIGSAVLVLIGVLGFPLLFDTQPRPIPVDIPIEIPGKGTVKPLVVPAAPATPTAAVPAPAAAPATAPAPTPADKVAAAASLAPKEEIVLSKPAAAASVPAAVKPDTKPEPKPEAKPTPKPEPKPAAKPEPKPVANADAARASALLNGTTPTAAKPAAAEAEGRLVVQVGAFADVAKAREARLKLEKAGLKTYTQVAETKDGKRIRVRVGPFATKAEAEKAAGKIKALDLPAAILTL